MDFFKSTLGLKIVMALSGLVGLGFVIGHMLGNLQIFLGAKVLNEYAASLHHNTALLWGARIVLLSAVIVHIVSAVKLTLRSKAARPEPVSMSGWLGASYATRTMRHGGVILLVFIVYHLLHLTNGVAVLPADYAANVDWATAGDKGIDVAANVRKGFSYPPTAIFYIIAQVLLGLHLTHGIHSMARTLGLSNPLWMERAKTVAIATGIAITLGNCSIVLAGLLGMLPQ